MRIRKRFQTPLSPPVPPPLAPSTPPHNPVVESFHHHQNNHEQQQQPQPPCNNPPPVTQEPHHHLQPPVTRSDLQLILVKGTHGWVCKTDADDCMHLTPSTQLKKEPQETSLSLDADSIHFSFGANEGLGNIVSTSFSQQDGDNKTVTVEDASETIKKKRKKADKDSVMTEGARCSRVNGRGWRCCQPTLVGYSLCEHHTSKGRIRSTTGNTAACIDVVKEEKVGSPLSSSPSPSLSPSPSSSSISVNEKPLMKTIMKRKKKGGVGKARSISSILGQTEPQCAPPLPIQIVDSVTGLR
ncbi:hypothetical protein ACHQM5_012404 [Ranunculus cassubicifolius]